MRALLHRQWPLLLGALLFAACAAALEWSMVPQQRGQLLYPLDDTYIQMAIAKNLAHDGTWGVTGEFANAGSSLLWPLMLAAAYLVFGVADWIPLALNVLAAVGVLAIASAVLQRFAPAGVRAGALLMIVAGVPLFHTARIGMEHVVVCAVALGVTAAVARACAAGVASWWMPLAGALLLSARFDLAAVAVPLALAIAFFLGTGAAARFGLGAVAPVVVSAMAAWRHGWPFLPTPILLKHRYSAIDTLDEAVRSLGGGVATLIRAPWLLVMVLACAWLLWHWRSGESRDRERAIMLVVTIVAVSLHVQFGQTGWLFRYETHLLTMGVVALAAAAAWLPDRWPGRAPVAVMAVAIAIAPFAWRTAAAVRELREETRYDAYTFVVADLLEQLPPPGGIVIGHVGVIGYRTGVPMIDAMGLLTPELLAPGGLPDPVTVSRLAASRGVRFSVEVADGWMCFGRWTIDGLTERLFAADADAAAQLRANIAAYRLRDLVAVDYGDRACDTTGLSGTGP